MSDTPRTDAFMKKCEAIKYPPSPYPIFDFARQLERDLADAQARIQALEQDAERYRWLRDYGGRTRYPDVVLPGITHRKASLFGDETFELLIGRAADAAIDSARGGA